MADDLSDYERSSFTHDGKERTVFRLGTGPAVVVIAEMPGITPHVAGFGRKVAGAGFTAVLPHLFGTPGRDGLIGQRPWKAVPYALSSMVPTCISREFHVLAAGRTSPVIAWLRALAASEHERCGGPGVGAVGMCFTGGFALAMAVEPSLLAPVLSQPSLPFSIGANRRRSIDCSPEDLAVVKQRCAAEGLTVLGLRFTTDAFVPAERFAYLREQLGDAFVAVEIDSSEGNEHGIPKKVHSVLTEHLVDEPGHPTREAFDQVLELFRTRLLA
jgi:dienelactone hydrolase